MAMAIYSASEIRRNHFPHFCAFRVPILGSENLSKALVLRDHS